MLAMMNFCFFWPWSPETIQSRLRVWQNTMRRYRSRMLERPYEIWFGSTITLERLRSVITQEQAVTTIRRYRP